MGFAAASLALTTVGAAMSAYSAYNQSKQAKPAYNYQAAIGRNNAKIAEWNAQEVNRQGEQELIAQQRKVAAITGAQRAAFGSRGIDMSEGSALNILSDTAYLGAQDSVTIKDNTAKKAWQARMQGYNDAANADLLQSRADAENPLLSGASSLLTSSGRVSNSWYSFKNAA
jgi:hypothetical protein